MADIAQSTGTATVYQQEGTTGSCGHNHGDYDMIVALGMDWMQNQYQSPYCGRRLRVTNKGGSGKGKVIEVTVADSCESCDRNHIDLSVGAWNRLTNSADWGVANIVW